MRMKSSRAYATCVVNVATSAIARRIRTRLCRARARASATTSGHVKIACLREIIGVPPGKEVESSRALSPEFSCVSRVILNVRGLVTRQPRERRRRTNDGKITENGLLVGLAIARLAARRTPAHGRRRVNLRAGRQRQRVLLPRDRKERLVYARVSGTQRCRTSSPVNATYARDAMTRRYYRSRRIRGRDSWHSMPCSFGYVALS